ncbi:MAG: hypothetical protein WCT39_03425 [Candidatus Margulisiibacteriota bacterium]
MSQTSGVPGITSHVSTRANTAGEGRLLVAYAMIALIKAHLIQQLFKTVCRALVEKFGLTELNLQFGHAGIQCTSQTAFIAAQQHFTSKGFVELSRIDHHRQGVVVLQNPISYETIELTGPELRANYSGKKPVFLEHIAVRLEDAEQFEALYLKAQEMGIKNFDVDGSRGVELNGRTLAKEVKTSDPTLASILEGLGFVEVRSDRPAL